MAAEDGGVPLPGPAPDPIVRAMSSVQAVRVDAAHVANIGVFLTRLSESIDRYIRSAARQSADTLRAGNYGQVALGDRDVGHVPELARKSTAVYDMVDTNLLQIMASLDDTADTMRKLGQRYRSDADFARMTMAEARRIFPPRPAGRPGPPR